MNFPLFLFFSLCLVKFSIGSIVQNQGISANYLYLFAPIFFYDKLRVRIYINWYYKLFFIIVCLVFFIGAFSDFSAEFYLHRRIASFLVFISIFVFIIYNVNERDIKTFTYSIVFVSLFYSLQSIITFFFMKGYLLDIQPAKNLVGSQRYGFVYLYAFWIVWCKRKDFTTSSISNYAILSFLFVGLLLTFSRSSYFSIILSILFYIIYYFIKEPIRNTLRPRNLSVVSLVLFFFICIIYSGIVEKFFMSTIVDYIFISGDAYSHLETKDSSVGHRIYIWTNVIKNLAENPLSGTAFLGSWSIDSLKDYGSFHNQHIDMLSRLGFLGYFIFCIIFYKLLKFLNCSHKGLFWGSISVFIYGCFHETYKESQGAFILSFLIGMHTNYLMKNKMRTRVKLYG